MPKNVEKYFHDHLDKTSMCWLWIGFTDKKGLPIIRTWEDKKLKEISVRRYSILIAGKELSSNVQVQPIVCRKKLCVNPDHLMYGDKARFWSKVQKPSTKKEVDECWIWIAAQDKDMYGKFSLREGGKKKDIRAHQYSWQIYTGRPVPLGLCVLHKCDHPYCVNPFHLFLGNNQDNTKDKVEKKRQSKGEKHGRSKITEKQVKKIRELFANKTHSQGQLSKIYGLSQSTISAIILKKIWDHVD